VLPARFSNLSRKKPASPSGLFSVCLSENLLLLLDDRKISFLKKALFYISLQIGFTKKSQETDNTTQN
jgi:hypothetical protein